MNNERRKIEFVTKAANGFRGIPMVLFGLALIISMILKYASELDAQRRNNYGKDLTVTFTFFFFCIAFGILGLPKIKNYYRKKYGQATAKPENLQSFIQNIFYMLPLLASFLVGAEIDAQYRLSFSATVMFVALFAFGLWQANYRGVSNVILYVAAIFFISSFLPWEKIFRAVTVLDDYYARGSFYRSICSLFVGAAYIVMGITDYRILSKTLKPITSEEEVYESV
jgi:hypothetical protein